MRPASQPFRLIFVEQGVTFKRDHGNMKTTVISTYRSPPNHHNVKLGTLLGRPHYPTIGLICPNERIDLTSNRSRIEQTRSPHLDQEH
ncbi:hypothetical protein P9112_004650 [Eukaryota sp. TZLM1-RC]